MGDSPTGGRLSPNRLSPNRPGSPSRRRGGGGEGSPGGISSNLLAEARKKAEDARENKEPPIGEQLKDLKQRITDTQKIVEELVALTLTPTPTLALALALTLRLPLP